MKEKDPQNEKEYTLFRNLAWHGLSEMIDIYPEEGPVINTVKKINTGIGALQFLSSSRGLYESQQIYKKCDKELERLKAEGDLNNIIFMTKQKDKELVRMGNRLLDLGTAINGIGGWVSLIAKDILNAGAETCQKHKDQLFNALKYLDDYYKDENGAKSYDEYADKKGRDDGKKHNDKANERPYRDPLVIDLDGDGFQIKRKDNGVYFDMDNNGTIEKTSWVGAKDAFLVRDINGDGKIDNSGEMFSDTTLRTDGTAALNGIEALADLDENKDGQIDEKDQSFSSIKIWQDINQNGLTDEGELRSLSEVNIKAIDVQNIIKKNISIKGSVLERTISFIEKDGTKGTIGEFMFDKDNFDTIENFNVVDSSIDGLSMEIKNLPNVRSFGNARSLHNEMFLDKSGELTALVKRFSESRNTEKRQELLEQILIKIAKAENVSPDSRGKNVNAQQVKVLEYLLGNPLVSGNLSSFHGQNYSIAYQGMKNIYYCNLLAQTSLKECVSFFCIKDKKLTNIRLFNSWLQLKIYEDKEEGKQLMKDAAHFLKYLCADGTTGFEEFKTYFSSISGEYAEIISRNEIFGSEQADVLYGGTGADILEGKQGDDKLNGGAGNDTYLFGRGDGVDTIYDYDTIKGNNDILRFKENILQMIFAKEGNDLNITLADSLDGIKIENWYSGSQYQIETFKSSDDKVMTNLQVQQLIDTMSAYSDKNGISWNNVIKEKTEDIESILSQYWVKSVV